MTPTAQGKRLCNLPSNEYLRTTVRLIENWKPYNEESKKELHKRLCRIMRNILVECFGYDAGTARKLVRTNLAGIAVSGETTLMASPIYMQISPDMCRMGLGIMVRKITSQSDYVGGPNNWLPITMLNSRDGIGNLAENIRRICDIK